MQEWFDAGAIGQVREVHCWTNRPIWPQGMPRPTDTPPVPEGLDWDLWIGPSPMRPVQPDLPPVRLARVAGLRRRRDGRHGVSRDGRGVHGPEARRADERHRDAEPTTSCRRRPDERRLRQARRRTTTAIRRRRSSTCRSRRAATCRRSSCTGTTAASCPSGPTSSSRSGSCRSRARSSSATRARCGARPTRRARASSPSRR